MSLATEVRRVRAERPGWDDYWRSVAAVVASRADCTRRQVGAVLVSPENRVLATGYNGAPAGDPGCLTDGACPRGRFSYEEVPADSSYSNCVAVHAEANALLYARTDARGSTLYVTDEPCHECRRLIRAAGIARTVVG